MRLLIQSIDTGRFLVPGDAGGDVSWVQQLREAGGGVVDDPETAFQLVQDWAELDERCQIVDLDRLGTAADYASADAAVAREAGGGGAPLARSSTLPDGNHGENNFFTQ